MFGFGSNLGVFEIMLLGNQAASSFFVSTPVPFTGYIVHDSTSHPCKNDDWKIILTRWAPYQI